MSRVRHYIFLPKKYFLPILGFLDQNKIFWGFGAEIPKNRQKCMIFLKKMAEVMSAHQRGHIQRLQA